MSQIELGLFSQNLHPPFRSDCHHGGNQTEKEGEGFERTVLVQFDSLDQAQRCYESDEYAAALRFSKKSSERLVVLVDGVDA